MSALLVPFAADFMARALLGGVLVAGICAVVGTWVVTRGMAFLGEAIGHGMLPGVAIATLAGWPAIVGGAVSAAAMSAAIGVLQRRGRLSYDTTIGLLFVGMLSLGVIIVSHSRSFATDATVMLFGDILSVGLGDIALLAGALAAVLALAAAFHRSFVAAAFDPRVAATLGLRPRLAGVVLTGLVTVAIVTTDAGLEVVDSGMWTWDHGDHFHYYRASPALPGTVPGDGPAIVTTPPLATSGAAGILFTGSGEAVSLDMDALSSGEIVERFRIPSEGTGGVLAPVGDAMLVAFDDGSGIARVLDEDGEPTGEEAACESPSGAIVTRVGTVVGCDDGALLAVASGGSVEIERVAYPADAGAPRAEAFDGRKNRPDVAGLAGADGFWILDTRAREWTHATTGADLVRVVAASDADENVVSLAADGSVRVYGPDGSERAATDPLVADPTADGVSLVVDAQRAYLSAPDAGVVYEIAYADDARVARELTPATAPDFATEAGR